MLQFTYGWIRFGLVVAPLSLAATAVQRRVLPDWQGALALLARIVVGLSLGLAVLEVIGAVGAFRPLVIVGAEASVGLLVAWRTRATGPWPPAFDPGQPSEHRAERLAVALTVLVLIAWLAVGWWVGRRGVTDNDSLRYHGPFVARWLQNHSLTHLQFTSNELQETFFPANVELLSSVGVATFGSDWLTPLLNVGWLALALLAGWTMVEGRRRPFAVVAVATVAGSKLLIGSQPGSARNDMASVALVLAAVALARRSHWKPAPLALGGAAAGLALGSKLSVMAPLAALTLGMVILAPKDRRVRSTLIWVAPLCLTGSFWYLRNWIRVGNPLPWYRLSLGPIHLPSPRFAFIAQNGRTIADYAGSAHFWWHTVPAGLDTDLGHGWPVFIVVIAGCVWSGLRSKEPFARLIAAVVIVAVVADLFTPYSAGGQPGPTMFPGQLRFLTLAAVLALLAGVMSIDVDKLAVLDGLAVVVIGLGLAGALVPPWLTAVLYAGLAIAIVGALCAWRSLALRRSIVAGVVVACCGCIPFSQWYSAHRYLTPGSHGAAAAFAYFRHVHHARIAIGVLLHTYPLSGADLSNYVQTIGETRPHGGFEPATTCSEWQELVDRGDYDYVVVGRAHSSSGPMLQQELWTAAMPDAHLLVQSGTTSVFRLDDETESTQVTCPAVTISASTAEMRPTE